MSCRFFFSKVSDRTIAAGIVANALQLVLVMAVLGGCSLGPHILSPYGSMQAAARSRVGAHPAIDYGGNIGDPVLAAADGEVKQSMNYFLCGNGIWISHAPHDRYTLYCHLHERRVAEGDMVKRGQIIGLLGATVEPTLRTPPGGYPIPQLHFQLSENIGGRNDGDLAGTFDPLSVTLGCFDPARTYPNDRFVLTHPVQCKDGSTKN